MRKFRAVIEFMVFGSPRSDDEREVSARLRKCIETHTTLGFEVDMIEVRADPKSPLGLPGSDDEVTEMLAWLVFRRQLEPEELVGVPLDRRALIFHRAADLAAEAANELAEIAAAMRLREMREEEEGGE